MSFKRTLQTASEAHAISGLLLRAAGDRPLTATDRERLAMLSDRYQAYAASLFAMVDEIEPPPPEDQGVLL